MSLLLGIEVGLDVLEALVVDASTGEVVAGERIAHEGDDPRALVRSCDHALAALDTRQVVAIALCGEHATVLLDGDGAPLGKVLDAPLSRLTPDDRARLALTPKDFVALHLSGEHGSDESSACSTELYDGAARRWSDAAIDKSNVSLAMLPPLGVSIEVLGTLQTDKARSAEIMRGADSRIARALAHGVARQGQVMLDDAAFVAPCQRWPSRGSSANVAAIRFADAAHAARIGQASTGLGFYKRVLCDGEQIAAEMRTTNVEELVCDAAQTSVGDGLFFLPHALVGFREHHNKADVSRAALEGCAFAFADAIAAWPIDDVRVSGRLAASRFWRQLLSDVIGAPVRQVASPVSPAYGAALMAACGIGLTTSLAIGCDAMVATRGTTTPDPIMGEKLAERRRRYRELSELLP